MFDFLIGNDLLSAIVAFVLVLIPAVLIHELGHFFAAKAVGITILEFGIGLPPRMLTLFTYKGTEYTLNWLPLGGFVRPLGEDMVRQMGDDALAQDRDVARQRGIERTLSVNEAPPLARILFLAGGALANFLLAIVLFVVVALIGIPEIIGGRAIVVDVEPESALAEAGLQANDVIEQINGEAFANADDFISRLYALDGETVTLTVRRPDENAQQFIDPDSGTMEITFTPDINAESPSIVRYPIILGVAEGSPAENAGMQPGDLITEINGQPISSFNELRELTQQNLDKEMSVTLQRGDETLSVSLVPRSRPPEGEGAMGIASTDAAAAIEANTGLTYQDGPPQEVLVSQSFGEAVQFSLSRTGEILGMIIRVPSELLAGTIEPEAARPVSVVGIGQMGGVFLQQSVQEDQPTIILNFIAVISIALGLTNLLPLPALDGGRIFFVVLEIIRGRPIAPEREGFVHLVGLALLLSAMVVLMLNDIMNPVTDLLPR